MGEIRVNVTLENTGDREVAARGLGVEGDVRRTTVEGVVDTGAVDLVIPEEMAQELGLRHTEREPSSTQTSDGKNDR